MVLDVGAGYGDLTEVLLNAGAQVVAVELHRQRAHALRERFSGSPVIVVQADVADLKLPRRPFRVVANPPFAVVEPLLRRLLARGSRLCAGDLVVPRQMARRWSGHEAPGSQRWNMDFALWTSGTVPSEGFIPAPPRDAKVLVIRRR